MKLYEIAENYFSAIFFQFTSGFFDFLSILIPRYDPGHYKF